VSDFVKELNIHQKTQNFLNKFNHNYVKTIKDYIIIHLILNFQSKIFDKLPTKIKK
jgi:hypothetical protein